jgi:hypothetical protein
VYEREALPRFIEEEFGGFLRCEFLAGGFPGFNVAGAGSIVSCRFPVRGAHGWRVELLLPYRVEGAGHLDGVFGK